MSKVTMPEPLGFIKEFSLKTFAETSAKGSIWTTITRSERDDSNHPIYTVEQMEAYAAAKVREALMEALGIVADARDSIGAGALAENAQYERSIVEPHLDGIDNEIRDLIPREPT